MTVLDASKNNVTLHVKMSFLSINEFKASHSSGTSTSNCPRTCKAREGGTLSCGEHECCVNGTCVKRADPGKCPPGQLPCRNVSRTTFSCCSKYCNLQTGKCDGK